MSANDSLKIIVTLILVYSKTHGVTINEIEEDLYWKQNFCTITSNETLVSIDVTYDCSDPDNVSIIPPDIHGNNTFYSLQHSNSCITSLPWDICDYPIVKIQIVNTSLNSILRLSCLKHLTDLDLSYNEIQYLSDGVFDGLESLRSLNLKYNVISSIGHEVFTDSLSAIMFVYLDGNQLSTAEAWPLRIRHDFCLFSVSHNKITRFSNEGGWRINKNQTYGKAWYDLTNNLFSTWITDQLKLFGFDPLQALGLLSHWVFDLRYNPWTCDCNFYTFLTMASNFPDIQNKQFFNLRCSSPAHFHGVPVLKLPLHAFVCNVTEECPTECLCQKQPARGLLFVDCSNGGLTLLPPTLPSGNITLILRNNSIDFLNNRSYLNRLVYLDISRNGLKYITPEAIKAMNPKSVVLDISNNELKYLPSKMKDFSHVLMANNTFICDCNSTWMGEWLQLMSKNSNVSMLKCSLPETGQMASVIEADDSFLKCFQVLTIVLSCVLGSAIVLVVVAIILYCVFKFEIKLMINTRFKQSDKGWHRLINDVYVCLNQEHEEVRLWARYNVLPVLERQNLRVYFPPRDTVPGTVATDEFIKQLRKSKSVLIILTQSYLDDPQKRFEFSVAYDILMGSSVGKLVVLRFPGVKWTGLRKLQAVIRLKKYVDVNDPNRNKKMLDMLFKKGYKEVDRNRYVREIDVCRL